MEQKDYIDITPVDAGGTGIKGLRNTVFQEEEKKHILENPRGLTKEGIEESIVLWKSSNNKHTVLKFEMMLARCKKIAESGKTPDGKIILARDEEGVPTWTKVDDKK